MRAVIIDCTELFKNPVRTGIQRVVREMLRHWPSDGPELHVARFEAARGLLPLPAAASALMSDQTEQARNLPHAELARAIADVAATHEALPLPKAATHFIPEVFYDPARSQFYQDGLRRGDHTTALLAYDFLPFLEPDLFHLRSAAPLMHYLRLVQAVPHIAHISHRTRSDYADRVMHGRTARAGRVLPLGADGLSMARQTWRPERRGFVALGSLDGRKNQDTIVAAFRRLWNAGHHAPLTLIGRPFEGLDLGWLEPVLGHSQFRWLAEATDAEVSAELTAARATIYVPNHEGFGLPPVESLFAGIPVIASQTVPSIVMLPQRGQLRLERVEPDLIADAVLQLSKDDVAAAAWREAAELSLPSWRDFAQATASWLTDH